MDLIEESVSEEQGGRNRRLRWRCLWQVYGMLWRCLLDAHERLLFCFGRCCCVALFNPLSHSTVPFHNHLISERTPFPQPQVDPSGCHSTRSVKDTESSEVPTDEKHDPQRSTTDASHGFVSEVNTSIASCSQYCQERSSRFLLLIRSRTISSRSFGCDVLPIAETSRRLRLSWRVWSLAPSLAGHSCAVPLEQPKREEWMLGARKVPFFRLSVPNISNRQNVQ